MPSRRSLASALLPPLLASLCVVPAACMMATAVHDLDTEAPPPEFGRPGWVRAFAKVGAWTGAIGGALVSVVTLPITYPISLLADEPLGYSREEFLFGPVTMGASFGHFLLGAPPDMVHFVFYRAWTEPGPKEIETMNAPVGPGVTETPPGQAGAGASAGGEAKGAEQGKGAEPGAQPEKAAQPGKGEQDKGAPDKGAPNEGQPQQPQSSGETPLAQQPHDS